MLSDGTDSNARHERPGGAWRKIDRPKGEPMTQSLTDGTPVKRNPIPRERTREREPLRETEIERWAKLPIIIPATYTPVIGAGPVLVYAVLLAHRFSAIQETVNPSIRTIARMSGLTVNSVHKYLDILAGEDVEQKLESAGLPPLIRIERTQRKKSKIKGANVYHFTDPELAA